MARMFELFRSASTVEVQLLQQRLRDHGVPTTLQGEHLAGMLSIGAHILPCRLMVAADDYDDAVAAMAVMEAMDAEPQPASPESCAACGESWEPGFGECWNCQAPLPT